MVLDYKRIWPGIDDSYYLSGDNHGQLNAFEEHAVRELTKHVLQERYPESVAVFLRRLVKGEQDG